jgi:hypothetical protein
VRLKSDGMECGREEVIIIKVRKEYGNKRAGVSELF